jgi:hypothetical protein
VHLQCILSALKMYLPTAASFEAQSLAYAQRVFVFTFSLELRKQGASRGCRSGALARGRDDTTHDNT